MKPTKRGGWVLRTTPTERNAEKTLPSFLRALTSRPVPMMCGTRVDTYRARNPSCALRSWSVMSTPTLQPRTSCARSEEHTSELQSHSDLVCRLLLEKKKPPTEHLSRAYAGGLSAHPAEESGRDEAASAPQHNDYAHRLRRRHSA